LTDARFGTWRDRVAYAEHWEKEFKAMEQHLSRIGQADFRLYQETKKWYVDVGDMLAYVNDVLTPRRFDEIVKNDFAESASDVTATSLMIVPPKLPKYVSAAFGSLDLTLETRPPPQRLRLHLLPQVGAADIGDKSEWLPTTNHGPTRASFQKHPEITFPNLNRLPPKLERSNRLNRSTSPGVSRFGARGGQVAGEPAQRLLPAVPRLHYGCYSRTQCSARY
jgi:hypothetical protein